MLMPMLSQQINANKRGGGILGIQEQTPGSRVKPQSQLHHPVAKVHVVSNLGQLDQLLDKYQKSCAVIFFTSATCPPCKTLYPVYDELAAETGDKGVLIKVDTSQAFDVGSRYSISATPTFITFLRGKQENRWSGADPTALRGNTQLLVQMAWPPHPHQALNLPTFSNPDAKPVIFSKIPPLPKLLAKMGPTASDPAIQLIAHFLELRASQGPAEAPLPDLSTFTSVIRSSLTTLPPDLLFTIIDLLRCALIDPRVSGFLAEEPNHLTLTTILTHTTSLPNCPYPLRLVTLQLTSNLFTTPLYPPILLSHPALLPLVVNLITTSLLDVSHPSIRVAAASLLYNVALANGMKRWRDGPGDVLTEEAQVELVAAAVEAIAREEGSAEALEGMVTGLGWLVYRVEVEGEVAELVRVLGAGEVIAGKGEVKGFEGVGKVVREVGEVLIGKGLVG
jgi:thiol-disulfide isomerase/thioredoxin